MLRRMHSKLIALENAWNQAQVHHDAKAVSNLVSDSFIYTDYDGTVMNKADFLKDLKDPDYRASLVANEWGESNFLSKCGDRGGDLSLQGNLQASALRTLRTLHRYLALPG